ncbi:hypothetical protein [Halovivax ruber]|nr:hypothetical protein [Halovivax ruber]
MGHDNTPEDESERLDTANKGTNRRQYLTAIAIIGSSRLVPSVVAGGQNADGELFRETVNDGGGTAAVSDSGEVVAFGVYGGTIRAYIADNEYEPTEFALPEISPGFTVSHVVVDEVSNRLVAAAMDDDTFGGGNLNDASGSPGTAAEWDSNCRDYGILAPQTIFLLSLPSPTQLKDQAE